jgi:hypothetical protein
VEKQYWKIDMSLTTEQIKYFVICRYERLRADFFNQENYFDLMDGELHRLIAINPEYRNFDLEFQAYRQLHPFGLCKGAISKEIIVNSPEDSITNKPVNIKPEKEIWPRVKIKEGININEKIKIDVVLPDNKIKESDFINIKEDINIKIFNSKINITAKDSININEWIKVRTVAK